MQLINLQQFDFVVVKNVGVFNVAPQLSIAYSYINWFWFNLHAHID